MQDVVQTVVQNLVQNLVQNGALALLHNAASHRQ